MLFDILEVGLGVLVDAHEVERLQEAYLHALLLQIEVHQVGRHQFALGNDALLLIDGERTIGKRTDIFENALYHTLGLLLQVVVGVKRFDNLLVFLLKADNDFTGAHSILQTIVTRNFEQCIRRSRHG